MATQVTYARILEVVTQGEDRFYRIAVQLPGGGEWSPGLIPASGYVMGDGLIFGAWVGEKFVPFRGGSGGGGAVNAIKAIIGTSAPAGQRRFVYQFEQAEGGDDPVSWREMDPAGIVGECYNPLEGDLGAYLSSGIDTQNLTAQDGSDFDVVPIAEGARCILTQVEGGWYIQSIAAIDGICSGGGA